MFRLSVDRLGNSNSNLNLRDGSCLSLSGQSILVWIGQEIRRRKFKFVLLSVSEALKEEFLLFQSAVLACLSQNSGAVHHGNA